MGYEYEFRFSEANEKYTSFNVHQPTPETMDSLLRAAPGFETDEDGSYIFHSAQDQIDAYALIKPFGIYLCLNDAPHHERHRLFNYLIHRIISEHAGLEIVEL